MKHLIRRFTLLAVLTAMVLPPSVVQARQDSSQELEQAILPRNLVIGYFHYSRVAAAMDFVTNDIANSPEAMFWNAPFNLPDFGRDGVNLSSPGGNFGELRKLARRYMADERSDHRRAA